ncbi:MAG: L,D-transpeptidase family protein [Azospirillaceae bacterium]
MMRVARSSAARLLRRPRALTWRAIGLVGLAVLLALAPVAGPGLASGGERLAESAVPVVPVPAPRPAVTDAAGGAAAEAGPMGPAVIVDRTVLARVAAIATATPTGPADELIVDKSDRRLFLMRDGAVLRSYRVALGREPTGAKRRAGDGRTPEGRYHITGLNPASRFHLSLAISYPDAEDVAFAREAGLDPGGDIVIHGLAPENAAMGSLANYVDWTEGCIAVHNEAIEEIAALTPVGTPILIRP